jgi:hypothetical protein
MESFVKNFKLVSVTACFFLFACSENPESIEKSDDGFISLISEGSVAEYSFKDLLSKETVKPINIDVCDFEDMSEKGEFILQCSKKGKHVPVKVAANQIQGFNDLSSTEEFGQHEYKWNHNGVTCNLSVHESDDILELWCRVT